eukprot:gene5604-7736_t
MALFLFFGCFALLISVECFHISRTNQFGIAISSKLEMKSTDYPFSPFDSSRNSLRSVLFKISQGFVAASTVQSIIKLQPSYGATETTPIVTVLGANGKTAKLVVEYLGKQFPTSWNIETVKFADVTKIDSLEGALAGSSAVVFAASASNKGGNAKQVDYLGVENVAKECIRLGIPRLIVISSGAVTKPDSFGYKITNLFGGIMDYKLKGENSLRELYKSQPSLSYAIVRPGGLQDGDAEGPSAIELNQGDTIIGEINRADVAQFVAQAAISKSLPKDVTFEIYGSESRNPLQPEFPKISGLERNGKQFDGSFEKIFEGLKSDGSY